MIIPPVGGASLTGVLPTEAGTSGGTAVTGSESFGKELSGAINSLEQSQQSSDAASQALATGTVKDPESAVVTVEDAQMTMELASQVRTKATEAVQNIFQTQV
jgi:flagellar hook-basal body complex protein FliE